MNAQLWLNTLCEGAAKFGKPLDSAPSWKKKMEAAGFVEIHEEVRKVRKSTRFSSSQPNSSLLSRVDRYLLADGLKIPSSRKLEDSKRFRQHRPLNLTRRRSSLTYLDGHRKRYRCSWLKRRMRSKILLSTSISLYTFCGEEEPIQKQSNHLNINAGNESGLLHGGAIDSLDGDDT